MAWCQEFGVQVGDGCAALVVARADSCYCASCDTTCKGKFAGCPDVWARGPHAHRMVMGPTVARRVATSTEGADGGGGPARPDPRLPVDNAGGLLRPLQTALAGHQKVLAELALHQERLARRQDALAARQEDLASKTLAVVQGLLSSLQRELATSREEIVASLGAHREQLAAQQKDLATLAQQQDRVADQLKMSASVSASAEARQDFFLTRIEQVTHHLSQSLGQTLAAIADLRAETERVVGSQAVADTALDVSRQLEGFSVQLERPPDDVAPAPSKADDMTSSTRHGAAPPRPSSAAKRPARPR